MDLQNKACLLLLAAALLMGCLNAQQPVPTATPSPEPTAKITATPVATQAPTATPVPTLKVEAVSACGKITQAGAYYLENGIALERGNSACITISTENAELDCRGNSVDSLGKNNTGILLEGANGSIVKNCNVAGFDQNVVLRNTQHSKIWGNTLSGFSFAVTLVDSSQNEVSGNNASGFLNGNGIRLSRSNYNTVSGNDFSKNEQGAFVNSSDGNAFLNNTARDNIFAGFWFYNSDNNTARNNNLTTSPKLQSHRAGIINQNGNNSFANNTVCTAAAYDFQCINGRAQDLGGNLCADKSNGCNTACLPCPS